MKKALATIGISSSLATVLINLIPDTELGLKVFLFIFWGAFAFGLSWTKSQIKTLFDGILVGAIMGILIGICVAAIDNSLSRMSATSGSVGYDFFLSLKWILPILVYTYIGVDPWKTKSIF
jgi:hypothetical protein